MKFMSRSQIEKYTSKQNELIKSLKKNRPPIVDKEPLPVRLKAVFLNREGGVRIKFNQDLVVPSFI